MVIYELQVLRDGRINFATDHITGLLYLFDHCLEIYTVVVAIGCVKAMCGELFLRDDVGADVPFLWILCVLSLCCGSFFNVNLVYYAAYSHQ